MDPTAATIFCCGRFLPVCTAARRLLLVFVMRLITSEADLTVSSLRKPNTAGAMNSNYRDLRTIVKPATGKIIKELPEVPEERYYELLCTAMATNASPLAPQRRQRT